MEELLLGDEFTLGRCVYRRGACACVTFYADETNDLICSACGHHAGVHVHVLSTLPQGRQHERPLATGPVEALRLALEDGFAWVCHRVAKGQFQRCRDTDTDPTKERQDTKKAPRENFFSLNKKI